MGSLIFFGMEKMPSEPQHKHHKLVIASEFTRIQLEFLNITESSKWESLEHTYQKTIHSH